MINIPGRHMVYNALAATCVGKTFGLSDSEIKSGIEKLKPVSGRNNIIEVGNLTVIDDCYNANPVSMKASIDVLSYAEGRKVAILGDMFELGDNESELHSEIGAYLTESNIDIIVLVGDLMNNAFKKLLQTDTNNKKVYYFENLEDALEQLDNIIKQDDTILVKASHGMKFSRIIDFFKTLL
jgi:UDP-N-acetylmuramoyl-tripeptide--D-alanyl-D-alanine ligase